MYNFLLEDILNMLSIDLHIFQQQNFKNILSFSVH